MKITNHHNLQLLLVATPDGSMHESFAKAAEQYDVPISIVTQDTASQLDPKQRYAWFSTKTGYSANHFIDVEKKVLKHFNVIPIGERTIRSNVPFYDMLADAGVPIAKSINIKHFTEPELKDIVNHLGGFPLLVRAPDKQMRGRGIIKVESYLALQQLLHYVPKNKPTTLQQFIPHDYSARLIVLGDEVICSYCNPVPESEFRSNAEPERNRYQKQFSDEVNQIAVHATHVRHTKFAGVDIIFDQDMNPYVTEANFPCNFIPPEKHFNASISEKIVEYFLKEADKFPVPQPHLTKEPTTTLLILTKSDEQDDDVKRLHKAADIHHLPAQIIDLSAPIPLLPQENHYLIYPTSTTNPEWEAKFAEQYKHVSLLHDLPCLQDSEEKLHDWLTQQQVPILNAITLTKQDRSDIMPYATDLNHYPISIQTKDQDGTTHHLYADSYHSLISLCDYCWTKTRKITLQPHLDIKTYVRLIVLGDDVIASTRFLRPNQQLKNWDNNSPRIHFECPATMKDLAIHIAQHLKAKWGVVHLLIDQNDQLWFNHFLHYFEFSLDQRATAVPIAEKIVLHFLTHVMA